MGTPIDLEVLRCTNFRVGCWMVEPQAGRLRQGTHSIHAEPKVMEVLLCLAARPGAVMSRDELLATAWSGVVVNEEALTRAVSELRTLLGDTARERCYIKTLPKRGYSLIAPVELLAEHKVEAMRKAPCAPAEPASRGRWIHSLAGGARRVAHRSAVAVGYLGLVFIAAGLLWNSPFYQSAGGDGDAAVQGDGRLEPVMFQPASRGDAGPRLRVAVLPFEVLTDNADAAALAAGIGEDLRVSLTRHAGLQVAGRRHSEQYGETALGEIELGEALGVDALIQGTVRRSGSSFRATVQVFSVSTGFPLWANRYDGDAGDMLALQSRIANEVAAQFTAATYPGRATENADTESATAESTPLFGHARRTEWLAPR